MSNRQKTGKKHLEAMLKDSENITANIRNMRHQNTRDMGRTITAKNRQLSIPEELKDLKRVSRSFFDAKVNEFMFLTKAQLLEKLEDPTSSVIEIWIIRIMMMGMKTGDPRSLHWFLERIVPKLNSNKTTSDSDDKPLNHSVVLEYIQEGDVTEAEVVND
jgi:hypothetical protein